MNQNSPRGCAARGDEVYAEHTARAHTLFNQLKKHTLWRYELSSAIFYGIIFIALNGGF